MLNGLARRVTLPALRGQGIQLKLKDPSYGWRDLEGVEVVDVTGANSATLMQYNGAVREYAYGVGDMIDVRFHLPHDHVYGSPLYLHLHWSHNGTNISGNLQADASYVYAKGHNQEPFCDPKVLSFDDPTVDIITTPKYLHKIPELQMTDEEESASVLNQFDIEVDGLILLNLEVTAIPTIIGGSAKPFIHRIDLHYQSTNIGTLNKSPYFYGN